MSSIKKVLVVGGGIAGLTLAVALRRRDIDVDIVELQPRVERARRRHQPDRADACGRCKSIGLIDQCVAVAFGFDRIVFADSAGQQFGALNMPRLCGPDYPATVAIARSALHDVLIRNAAGARRLDHARRHGLVSESEAPTRSRSSCPTATRASYDFVVGCDGSRSTVRSLAFNDVPDASFTGLAVWRATMPRHKAVDCMQMFYGPNTKAGVNPHSRDEMFLFLVQPIRDGQRLPPDQMHVLLAEQLRDFSGDVMSARARMGERSRQGRLPADEFVSAAAAVAPRPRRRDRRRRAHHHAASGDRGGDRHRGRGRAGGIAGRRPCRLPSCLDRFMARRFARCRLVVETAVKLGEMEKDKTIPIQAHFDLMSATFRQACRADLIGCQAPLSEHGIG